MSHHLTVGNKKKYIQLLILVQEKKILSFISHLNVKIHRFNVSQNIHGGIILVRTVDGDIDSYSKLSIFLFKKCM